ncbi:hypothetical protein L3Q82_008489 [Scortum barcoo]|uniref:Uncharacterized protein n=1 Tax=Scortum barcoo TaxID=214431 RepID=A0ACB8XBB9_9TELE|nr:hypothetical protein L3Q82_008489 [Scortum barcoo]
MERRTLTPVRVQDDSMARPANGLCLSCQLSVSLSVCAALLTALSLRPSVRLSAGLHRLAARRRRRELLLVRRRGRAAEEPREELPEPLHRAAVRLLRPGRDDLRGRRPADVRGAEPALRVPLEVQIPPSLLFQRGCDRDDSRIPHEISVAECLCSGCIVNQREESTYNSVPVFAQRMVLKKSRCPDNPNKYVVRRDVIKVPVACTCVVPKQASQ